MNILHAYVCLCENSMPSIQEDSIQYTSIRICQDWFSLPIVGYYTYISGYIIFNLYNYTWYITHHRLLFKNGLIS